MTVYRVRPGDTIWSIATEHGATVKELLAANGWAGQGPVIYEGQAVRLPVRACAPAGPDAGREDVRDLWEGAGSAVRALSAGQVEDLTRASAYRPAAHDTLLVVYAPWCPHCRAMEPAVEALARQLEGDPSVVVAKLRGDLPGARSFAYGALGAKTFPTVVALGRDNGVPATHRGARDRESLLEFLNAATRRLERPAEEEAAAAAAEPAAGAVAAGARSAGDGGAGALARRVAAGIAGGAGKAGRGVAAGAGSLAGGVGSLAGGLGAALRPPAGQSAIVHTLGVAALAVAAGVVLRGALSTLGVALWELRAAWGDFLEDGDEMIGEVSSAWRRVGKRTAAASHGAQELRVYAQEADKVLRELAVGLAKVLLSRVTILGSQGVDAVQWAAASAVQALRAVAVTAPRAVRLAFLALKSLTAAALRTLGTVLGDVAAFARKLLTAVLFLLGVTGSVTPPPAAGDGGEGAPGGPLVGKMAGARPPRA